MTPELTIDYLTILDPVFQLDAVLGERLLQSLGDCQLPPGNEISGRIAALVEGWLGRNPEVAAALTTGCCELLSQYDGRGLAAYLDAVSAAGQVTPVLARSAAEKFVVVCATNSPLLYDLTLGFFREIGPWGPYPLGQVSNGVLASLKIGGAELGTSFARMIAAALKQGVVEKELVRLVERLITGIKGFDDNKRLWQAIQLEKVIKVDRQLAPAFLRGLERGVSFLKVAQLKEFVDAALDGDDRVSAAAVFWGLRRLPGVISAISCRLWPR